MDSQIIVEQTEESTSGLLQALLAVQSEAPTLPKDGKNPHFGSSYTPLDTIVEIIGPLLARNGLVWMTMPCRDEHGDPALHYRLAHAATGEVLEGTMPLLLTKADPQGMGSAITYARRYSLCAVLNLVADADDDGNAARARTSGRQANGVSARAPQSSERPATAKQRGLINVRASDAGLTMGELANAVLLAAGQDARVFDTDEAAKAFVARQLDRLPGALVDGVLLQISNIADAGAEA